MGENVFHNISRNLIFCSVYVRQSLAREARKVIHNRGRRRWKTFCHLYREMKHRSAIFTQKYIHLHADLHPKGYILT